MVQNLKIARNAGNIAKRTHWVILNDLFDRFAMFSVFLSILFLLRTMQNIRTWVFKLHPNENMKSSLASFFNPKSYFSTMLLRKRVVSLYKEGQDRVNRELWIFLFVD